MARRRPRPGRVALRTLAVAAAWALALAPAAGAGGFQRDRTPLPPDVTSGRGSAAISQASGAGGTFVRLLVGLGLVLALVFVVRTILRRAQRGSRPQRRGGGEVVVQTTVPLGGTRAVHLLRVGDELVLVGSAEQGVTKLRVYSAEEAQALFAEDDADPRLRPVAPDGGAGGFGRALDELRRRTAR